MTELVVPYATYHDEEGGSYPSFSGEGRGGYCLYYSVGSSKHEGLSGTGTNAYGVGTTNPVDGQCNHIPTTGYYQSRITQATTIT